MTRSVWPLEASLDYLGKGTSPPEDASSSWTRFGGTGTWGYQAGWQDSGGFNRLPDWRVDAHGRVYLRGSSARLSATAGATHIMTLPSAYRPEGLFAYWFPVTAAVDGTPRVGTVEVWGRSAITGNPGEVHYLGPHAVSGLSLLDWSQVSFYLRG